MILGIMYSPNYAWMLTTVLATLSDWMLFVGEVLIRLGSSILRFGLVSNVLVMANPGLAAPRDERIHTLNVTLLLD